MSESLILVTRALDFAAHHHTDQRRKGARSEPYINHLAEVAYLLAVATDGGDPELIAAALLHDAVEDTHVTLEEIEHQFGHDVAQLVAQVTDDKSLPKAERKRLQVETVPSPASRNVQSCSSSRTRSAICARCRPAPRMTGRRSGAGPMRPVRRKWPDNAPA